MLCLRFGGPPRGPGGPSRGLPGRVSPEGPLVPQEGPASLTQIINPGQSSATATTCARSAQPSCDFRYGPHLPGVAPDTRWLRHKNPVLNSASPVLERPPPPGPGPKPSIVTRQTPPGASPGGSGGRHPGRNIFRKHSKWSPTPRSSPNGGVVWEAGAPQNEAGVWGAPQGPFP